MNAEDAEDFPCPKCGDKCLSNSDLIKSSAGTRPYIKYCIFWKKDKLNDYILYATLVSYEAFVGAL